MKKRFSLLIGLFLYFLILGSANASTIAFDFANGGSGFSNDSWVFGQKFTVAGADITVDSLGYYDHAGDGFLSSHEVGIFTESGSLLASTTVTSSDTYLNYFRWSSISDLTLLAGESYRVVGVSHDDLYNSNDNNFITDSRIIDNGFAYYQGSTLGIGDDQYGFNQVWAANFTIKGDGVGNPNPNPVPEPATMLLFGFGLLGLAGVNRRKK